MKGSLSAFLEKCPSERGYFLISKPRPFAHPEEEYDQQYGHDKLDLAFHRTEGEGILDLCREYGSNPNWPMLEIGCGTGRLSLSLVLASDEREILISDPSPSFCDITVHKLAALPTLSPNVHVGVLTAEDVALLPKATFSIIILRSVLHHVLDVNGFLSDCSEILVPGGLLLFEEPCTEGYLLMGAITQFLPAVFKSKDIALSERQLSQIKTFADGMLYYARRDLDKSMAEDKHLFRPEELGVMCRSCNMSLDYFPNRTFADIRERLQPHHGNYFEQFYYGYLKYALSWDADLIELVVQHAAEYLRYFSPLAAKHALPPMYSTFICKKAPL